MWVTAHLRDFPSHAIPGIERRFTMKSSQMNQCQASAVKHSRGKRAHGTGQANNEGRGCCLLLALRNGGSACACVSEDNKTVRGETTVYHAQNRPHVSISDLEHRAGFRKGVLAFRKPSSVWGQGPHFCNFTFKQFSQKSITRMSGSRESR